jgi:hypothetical protein
MQASGIDRPHNPANDFNFEDECTDERYRVIRIPRGWERKPCKFAYGIYIKLSDVISESIPRNSKVLDSSLAVDVLPAASPTSVSEFCTRPLRDSAQKIIEYTGTNDHLVK